MLALTGLRGIAAVWVMTYHLSLDMGFPFFQDGYLGVDAFFMLSGFILTHVYGSQAAGWGLADYLRFLQVRLARIYPLHFAALIILALMVLALPGFADARPHAYSLDSFIASLLLIQNWAYWSPFSWNVPSWSLSAEWFAYLTFPILMMVMRPVRAASLAMIMAILVVSALLLLIGIKISFGHGSLSVAGSTGMVRMACEFTAGCLLYRAHSAGLRISSRQLDLIVAAGLLSAVVLHEFIYVFAFGALILAGARQDSVVTKLLGCGATVFLGEISFSLYLLHPMTMWLIDWMVRYGWLAVPADYVVPTVIKIACILPISVASYYWLERPARDWGRRLAMRKTAAAT